MDSDRKYRQNGYLSSSNASSNGNGTSNGNGKVAVAAE